MRARYLIGADGNMSAVRRLVFGELPDYIGTVFWRTMVIYPTPCPA